jgi:Flp pilus assembly protein TadB
MNDYGVAFIAVMGVVAVVGAFHEWRAVRRDKRAELRHDKEMIAIAKNNVVTLEAIHQRDRLTVRMLSAEEAINEHAAALEKLGVENPARVQVGERPMS